MALPCITMKMIKNVYCSSCSLMLTRLHILHGSSVVNQWAEPSHSNVAETSDRGRAYPNTYLV